MPKRLETCCICLDQCLFFQSINKCDSRDVKYVEKLKTCIPNAIWDDDFCICNHCVEKLDAAYDFVQVCLKSEEHRKELIRVEQAKAEESTSFTCHECGKSFRLKRTLNLHITRIHLKLKKTLKIEVAKVKNDTEPDYVIPKVKHEDSIEETIESEILDIDKVENGETDCENNDFYYNPIDGNISNYSSDEGSMDKKPVRRRGRKKNSKPQTCEYCNLIFTRNDKFHAHVRSKHTFEKPFKCDLCDSKYYSSHNLVIHKRKHTNEKPYVCAVCGKSFISSNDLWQHCKIHETVRQYGCNECDRSFKTHSNLRTHKLQMHQHPDQWKFICTVCGKKFPLNNNLVKHMRRHEGIKQFACHLCEKRFVEKIDLQTHLISHSNERLYKCNLCEKEYKKRETLRRHLKIEHDVGNMTIKKPEKKLNCPMCPKIFAFNNKLQRHILTHTGEKPITCSYCEKRFRDNYDRNVHLRKDHNVEPSKYA